VSGISGLVDQVQGFLEQFPEIKIIPDNHIGVTMEGILNFTAQFEGSERLTDGYHLRFFIPQTFPESLPIAIMKDARIDKTKLEDFHIHQESREICLGSPIRLKLFLAKNPSLLAFTKEIIIPYLYSVSIKLKSGGKFLVGELDHHVGGLLQDYESLFKLKSEKKIQNALIILGMKERTANAQPCPCGCERRYIDCDYRKHLEQFRIPNDRDWFRNHITQLSIKS